MNTISKLIEQQAIDQRMPVDFYAGFERFSRFAQQASRYQELGAICRRVYVFGLPDATPPPIPGVQYVALDPASPLAREWFLVVDTPTFWTALLTQETDERDPLTGGRRFDGVWSYDAAVVERASLLLSQQLGHVYQPVAARDHTAQCSSVTQISNAMLDHLGDVRQASRRRHAQTLTLQQIAEASTRHRDTPRVNGYPLHLLQAATQVLHNTFGASEVAVAFQNGKGAYRVVAVEGEQLPSTQLLNEGEGPSGQALKERAVVRVANARDGDRDPLLPWAQSVLAAPLLNSSGLLGVMTIGSREPNSWSEDDADVLRAVVGMLALAIEHQQVRAEAIVSSERARRIEKALLAMRQPVASLLDAGRQMRSFSTNGSTLSTAQLGVLAQSELVVAQLAQLLRVPLSVAPPVTEAPLKE